MTVKPFRKEIVLASGSPRRKQLLELLGLPFTVMPADADETFDTGWAPHRIVCELALRKVRTIIPQFKNTTNAQTLVVGADTLVFLDGEALGKPIDEQDAFRMLTALQGRMHQVYTGLAVVDTVSGSECVDFRMTHVHMKSLTAEQIGRYIATGEPMDKAGSYAVQGLGAVFVERIEGCYFNVVGLPVSLLAAMLDKFEAVVL